MDLLTGLLILASPKNQNPKQKKTSPNRKNKRTHYYIGLCCELNDFFGLLLFSLSLGEHLRREYRAWLREVNHDNDNNIKENDKEASKTELMMTPFRLSVLGLIAMGANDVGNCDEVYTECDLLP